MFRFVETSENTVAKRNFTRSVSLQFLRKHRPVLSGISKSVNPLKMKKYLLVLLLLAGFTALQASTPFPPSTLSGNPAITGFTISKEAKKILLNWSVNSNNTADRVEVEKSTDNKQFSLAALVWCSDKPTNDQYTFYEAANRSASFYRLKLIGKDGTISYSAVLPAVK